MLAGRVTCQTDSPNLINQLARQINWHFPRTIHSLKLFADASYSHCLLAQHSRSTYSSHIHARYLIWLRYRPMVTENGSSYGQ